MARRSNKGEMIWVIINEDRRIPTLVQHCHHLIEIWLDQGCHMAKEIILKLTEFSEKDLMTSLKIH
jgi:hypothetical protein